MAIVVIFPAAALGHARSGAMIYLVVGVVIGPVVSLFAIRIHLRVSERDRLWMPPLRLCGPAMLVTIELMSGFNARRRPLARHDALSCGLKLRVDFESGTGRMNDCPLAPPRAVGVIAMERREHMHLIQPDIVAMSETSRKRYRGLEFSRVPV
jgi:hypothetical protein